MKFFKDFFWALFLNTILIFSALFGCVCGICLAKSSKFAEEIDKRCSSSLSTQSLSYDNGVFSFDGYYIYQNSWVYTGLGSDGDYEGWGVDRYYFCKFDFALSSSGFDITMYDMDGYDYYSHLLISNGWHYSQVVILSETSFFRLHLFKDDVFDYDNIVSYRYCGVKKWGDEMTLGYENELIDINGNVFYFGFFCRDTSKGFDWVSDMTFDWVYFDVASISTDTYKQGFTAGYNEGKSDGINEGYTSGYGNGYRVGEQIGFSNGVDSANDYSFLALIGAVVDAPLSAFTGLLNFEILGFNFLSLITGILTIGLLFVFIRFIFFRK